MRGPDFVHRERTSTKAAPPPRKVPAIQAKLVVGSVDDPAEREADATAARVINLLDRPESADVARSFAQTPAARISRKAVVGAGGGDVDADTERQISSARSGGAPLDGKIRRRMEGAFGADFSGVRMHVGAQADDLNSRIQARAFTTGSDVFVRREDYKPDTRDGQRLLAHELAHTIQQGGATISRALLDESESEETEANETETEEAKQEEAEHEEAESEESKETDGEEEIDIDLPTIVSTEEDTIAAGTLMEDASSTRSGKRTGTTSRPSAPDRRVRRSSALEWAPVVNTSATVVRSDAAAKQSAAEDKVSTSAKLNTKASTGGGYQTTPFGALDPAYAATNVAAKVKKGKIYLSADVEGTFTWGTNPGGRTDVAGPTDGVITAANYAQIVSDLTPALVEKSWRAPRKKFWSAAICERHEKVHAKDFTKWFKSKAKGVVSTFLKKNPVELSEEEQKDEGTVKTETTKVLTAAMNAVAIGAMDDYRGGATSYLSYKGEEHAFGDGKKPYEKLAAGVKKQGQKLEAAAKKASAATEPTTDTPTV